MEQGTKQMKEIEVLVADVACDVATETPADSDTSHVTVYVET